MIPPLLIPGVEQLDWTEKAYREAPVLAVNICMPIEFEFTMETIGLFDQLPAWNEATVGTLAERKAKLADPARRPALKRDMEKAPTLDAGDDSRTVNRARCGCSGGTRRSSMTCIWQRTSP